MFMVPKLCPWNISSLLATQLSQHLFFHPGTEIFDFIFPLLWPPNTLSFHSYKGVNQLSVNWRATESSKLYYTTRSPSLYICFLAHSGGTSSTSITPQQISNLRVCIADRKLMILQSEQNKNKIKISRCLSKNFGRSFPGKIWRNQQKLGICQLHHSSLRPLLHLLLLPPSPSLTPHPIS